MFSFVCVGKLDKEAVETEILDVGINTLEFFREEASVEGLVFLREGWGILGHQTQGEVGTKFQKKRGQSLQGILHFARENQVAYQDPLLGDLFPRFKGVQEALLFYHFGNGLKGDIRIIPTF